MVGEGGDRERTESDLLTHDIKPRHLGRII